MRFAQVFYVMGTNECPEHYGIVINQGTQQVSVLRVFTRDYDSTPGFNGAQEEAYSIAEELVPEDNVFADDLTVRDILAILEERGE